VQALALTPLVRLIDSASLPTEHGHFQAHAFLGQSGAEHMALVSQGQAQGAPLVRMHSECLTGDGLGSLRCDCGPQLRESLRRLSQSPGGILLYLRGQEGRGIGLGNKLRAYALQDRGMDTVEANRALGLPDDARSYAEAGAMLQVLSARRIRLLTNNPDKVAALVRLGIEVQAVEPLVMPANPHNLGYLATKARKFGHRLTQV